MIGHALIDMDHKAQPDWIENALGADEGRARELRRLDPADILGWAALAATLFNIAVSLIRPGFVFDELISVSFVCGVLSILNRKSRTGKIALGVMLVHAVAVHLLW